MPASTTTILQNINDAVVIPLTNNSLGQDGAASFTVSPGPSGFGNMNLVFEKVSTAADLANNNWTALGQVTQLNPVGVQLNNGGVSLGNAAAGSTVYNFLASTITGYFQIRCRISVQPTFGSVSVNGVSFPAVVVSNPAEVAALISLQQANLSQVLGLSILADLDLQSAVGGSF